MSVLQLSVHLFGKEGPLSESIKWFIEEQAFSPSYDFNPPPLLPLSPSKHTRRLSKRWGTGRGRNQIVRRRESLVLYKHSIYSGFYALTACILCMKICIHKDAGRRTGYWAQEFRIYDEYTINYLEVAHWPKVSGIKEITSRTGSKFHYQKNCLLFFSFETKCVSRSRLAFSVASIVAKAECIKDFCSWKMVPHNIIHSFYLFNIQKLLNTQSWILIGSGKTDCWDVETFAVEKQNLN